LLRNWAKY